MSYLDCTATRIYQLDIIGSNCILPRVFGKFLIFHVYSPNFSLLQILDHSLARPKKDIKCPAVRMVGLLEDVSGAQNLEKHLNNHKVLKSLLVIIVLPPPSHPPATELETLCLGVRTF